MRQECSSDSQLAAWIESPHVWLISATLVGGHLSKTPRGNTWGFLFVINVAVLIDVGHLRVLVNRIAKKTYNPDYIEKVARACIAQDEALFRTFYYDSAPYNGSTSLPVFGASRQFIGSDRWLKELAIKDLFVTRLGILKFRGFKAINVLISLNQLTDADIEADLEQKGVDMRIGLDIATFAGSQAV